jgi:deoxyribonucleoside regulator
MERVIGIELDQLRRVPRSILVCGGAAKHEAILAALRGNLGDVLITDQFTASALLHP